MIYTELAKRNANELLRDPLTLGIALALPLALLLALQSLGGDETPFMEPTRLTPGVVLFGFVMVMFSSAMILARDRETALLARLLTTPLRASDFVLAYSLPYLIVMIAQAALLYVVGAFLGLDSSGSIALVFLVLVVMAVFYVATSVILGALFTVAQVSGGYAAVLLLTIFGGAWFDLEEIGGPFQSVGNVLPFAHALDAVRAVMVDGVGFADIATDLAWVAGYAAVAGGAAVLTFRRRMVE